MTSESAEIHGVNIGVFIFNRHLTKVRRTLSLFKERSSIGVSFPVFIIVSLFRKGNENPAEKQSLFPQEKLLYKNSSYIS